MLWRKYYQTPLAWGVLPSSFKIFVINKNEKYVNILVQLVDLQKSQ